MSRAATDSSASKVVLEVVSLAALLVLLVYGGLRLQPAVLGTPSPPLAAVLIAGVLPVVTVVLLSILERCLPAGGPRKPIGRWLLHLRITVFFTFMVGLSVALAAALLSAAARAWHFEVGLIDLRFADGAGFLALLSAAWVSAVVTDFFFYWYHRALHTFPVLWAHHKLHHMDRELEAMTLARQNWIEVFLAAGAIVTPMLVLFKLDACDPWSFGLLGGVTATVFSSLLVIGHANLRVGVGRASILWCSPQVHRIHHSHLPQHQDKNFAFTLPLWDVLFGTYYAPAADEYPPTGVDGETEITSFWESQIFTQREWWRMIRRWRARRRTAAG